MRNKTDKNNKQRQIVKKHSAAVQISNTITALQRKAFDYMLKQAIAQYKAIKEGKIKIDSKFISKFYVPKKELMRYLGLGENYTFLKEQLEKLTTTSVKYNLLHKDKGYEWGVFNLLAGVSFTEKEGHVVFSFPHQIVDRIIEPRIYAILDLAVIKGLKSKYAIALYEFLMDYRNSPKIPNLTINKFKELMGVPENTYKNDFHSLKRFVIDRAVNELNQNSEIPFSVSYTLERSQGGRGRQYTHIQFSITSKLDKYLEDIKLLLPEKEQKPETLNEIKKLIEQYGVEQVKSAVLYTARHKYDNFVRYLSSVLKNGFAGNMEEEVENALKKKKIKMKKKEEEKIISEIVSAVVPLIHSKEEFSIMADKMITLALTQKGYKPGTPEFAYLLERALTETGNKLATAFANNKS